MMNSDTADFLKAFETGLEKGFAKGFEKGKEYEHRWWSEHCASCTDADRPQGEWKEHWYPHFDVAGIECSICSKDVPYWERNYDMPRYCPNCRAKMKGADDEV